MTTRIIAIRHGKPLSEGYAEDALRPLSDEGREVQKKTASELFALGYHPDLLLTSPLLRAQQTAEVIGEIFGMECKDEEALGVDFNPDVILSRIPENATVVLVGHAPTLAEFVNHLAGANALPYGLSKSAIAVVEFEGKAEYGKGTLTHHISP